MATQPEASLPSVGPLGSIIRDNLVSMKARWWVFLLVGILLIVTGMVAISCAFTATMATMLVFGWLLLIAGAFQFVGSFGMQGWGGFFLSILLSVLYIVVGFVTINNPVAVAEVYTLFLGMFFLIDGMFRIISAVAARFEHWILTVISGVVTVALGVLIYYEWPYSGLWVIGLFVGIQLLFSGWVYFFAGLRLRNLPV